MVKRYSIFCCVLLCCAALWLCFSLTEAFCAEPKAEKEVYAIQERIFHAHHEIGLDLGYIPDDDFYELYPVGLNYTFNFNEHLSWEVARALWVLNDEKDLKKNLETNFGAAPTKFTKTKYMLHSHLVLKPLYGKDAIWNRGIINHETFFFLGGGMVHYARQADSFSENAPSVSLGFGIKYFLNKHLFLNIRVQNLTNFKEENTENNLWFGIDLGFRFNLTPRKRQESSTINILNRYLKEDEDR